MLRGDDIGEGTGTLAQNQIVEHFREGEAKRAQFRWKGESHHEVGHWEEAGLLFRSPELLIESAALRAVAMVAAIEPTGGR
jgi:hypothetical protein